MKILVRLPNWLGDVVMSAAFIEQLQFLYPDSEISVIIKKGLEPLLNFMPQVKQSFIFSKQEHKGIRGSYAFGNKIKKQQKFDVFFSLPDSFSSALMGFATGAKIRVGYKKELRFFLQTKSYHKNKMQHRVKQYLDLLRFFSGKMIDQANIVFDRPVQQNNSIVININSAASSRRLPEKKAISIIENVRKATTEEIILIGSGNEKEFVEKVFNSLSNKTNIKNIAGETSLFQLADILSSANVMLSTDSGPAHLSNALGVHTIALFGAGNENETGPFNSQNRTIIRLGQLSCEPCLDNICKRYGTPKCLSLLDEVIITNEVLKHL